MGIKSDLLERYKAPRNEPLKYPGIRPEKSYILANRSIRYLDDSFSKNGRKIIPGSLEGFSDSIIDFSGRDSISIKDVLQERYAVIGYGSNLVPGQLISKFGEDAIIPVLLGEAPDIDIVYNLISNQGYAFAELLLDENGLRAPIGITLLNDEQMNKMIETEQNYKVGFAPFDVESDMGLRFSSDTNRVYMFAGFRKIWVPEGYSKPVPIAEIKTKNRKRKALSQREVLTLAIDEFNLKSRDITSPKELVEEIRNEALLEESPGKLKYDLQKYIDENPKSYPALANQIEILTDLKKQLKPYFK